MSKTENLILGAKGFQQKFNSRTKKKRNQISYLRKMIVIIEFF